MLKKILGYLSVPMVKGSAVTPMLRLLDSSLMHSYFIGSERSGEVLHHDFIKQNVSTKHTTESVELLHSHQVIHFFVTLVQIYHVCVNFSGKSFIEQKDFILKIKKIAGTVALSEDEQGAFTELVFSLLQMHKPKDFNRIHAMICAHEKMSELIQFTPYSFCVCSLCMICTYLKKPSEKLQASPRLIFEALSYYAKIEKRSFIWIIKFIETNTNNIIPLELSVEIFKHLIENQIQFILKHPAFENCDTLKDIIKSKKTINYDLVQPKEVSSWTGSVKKFNQICTIKKPTIKTVRALSKIASVLMPDLKIHVPWIIKKRGYTKLSKEPVVAAIERSKSFSELHSPIQSKKLHAQDDIVNLIDYYLKYMHLLKSPEFLVKLVDIISELNRHYYIIPILAALVKLGDREASIWLFHIKCENQKPQEYTALADEFYHHLRSPLSEKNQKEISEIAPDFSKQILNFHCNDPLKILAAGYFLKKTLSNQTFILELKARLDFMFASENRNFVSYIILELIELFPIRNMSTLYLQKFIEYLAKLQPESPLLLQEHIINYILKLTMKKSHFEDDERNLIVLFLKKASIPLDISNQIKSTLAREKTPKPILTIKIENKSTHRFFSDMNPPGCLKDESRKKEKRM